MRNKKQLDPSENLQKLVFIQTKQTNERNTSQPITHKTPITPALKRIKVFFSSR